MKMKIMRLLLTAILGTIPFSSAVASDGINSGDTAWVIVSTALVMMMTPAGLALFYGGLSRYKNLLNTYAMTIVAYCLVSVIWVMWGYSMAFGPDKAGIIGSLDNVFLTGISVDSVSGSIPTYVFVLFQMTFAGIFGFYSVTVLKQKLGYDDSLDAFGVHGMFGIWGALATGLFANPSITDGAKGLFYGNPKQLLIQIVSILATAIFTAMGTLMVGYTTKLLTGGLRVEEDNEISGLDQALHGERAFEIQTP